MTRTSPQWAITAFNGGKWSCDLFKKMYSTGLLQSVKRKVENWLFAVLSSSMEIIWAPIQFLHWGENSWISVDFSGVMVERERAQKSTCVSNHILCGFVKQKKYVKRKERRRRITVRNIHNVQLHPHFWVNIHSLVQKVFKLLVTGLLL